MLEAKHVEGISTTKRFAFDLVEAAVEVEQGDRRAAAVRPQNAELTAVDLVYAVGNVDLHLAAFGQRLGRVVDDGAFVEAGVGEFGDRPLERAVVLPDRIDVRFDRASVGEPVGRGFDLWIGRKGDREGISRIAVFLPGLGGCRAAGDECREGVRSRASSPPASDIL